jgi:membrane fusion protein (multidrug efflux system)
MNLKDIARNRKRFSFALLAAVVIIGVIAVLVYLRYKETHVSTDDAFVEGHVYTIAPKIPGTVKALYITDNQHVKENERLLEIDPADYDVKLRQARADLDAETKKIAQLRSVAETARRQLAEILAAAKAARSDLALREANLRLATKEYERAETLVKKGYTSREDYDTKKAAYEVSQDQVTASRDNLEKAEAAVKTQLAAIRQADTAIPSQEAVVSGKKAALQAAELNRSYTVIHAPAEGYVTQRNVEVGNQVQAGQPLLSIVPLNPDAVWITANYKETDLKSVKPGQKVLISVDSYPGRVFHGRVNSIMAGTGSAFSLFPPENATGNYVKVVQRIPVKINLDEGTDPEHLLRIGMSVVPTILVGS